MSPVIITLSQVPVSTNNLFANNRRTGGRFITDHYKQWRNEAGWELLRQKPRSIRGQVCLDIRIQDGTGRDLSNMIKAVEDLLVTHEVIQGDGPKYVRKITMAFARDVSGVVVTICREGDAA